MSLLEAIERAPRVLSWDVSHEAPAEPETWVQSRQQLQVCGGLPNIVGQYTDGRVYRHTPDGRLWERVA